jgi:hypothetical protein
LFTKAMVVKEDRTLANTKDEGCAFHIDGVSEVRDGWLVAKDANAKPVVSVEQHPTEKGMFRVRVEMQSR